MPAKESMQEPMVRPTVMDQFMDPNGKYFRQVVHACNCACMRMPKDAHRAVTHECSTYPWQDQRKQAIQFPWFYRVGVSLEFGSCPQRFPPAGNVLSSFPDDVGSPRFFATIAIIASIYFLP